MADLRFRLPIVRDEVAASVDRELGQVVAIVLVLVVSDEHERIWTERVQPLPRPIELLANAPVALAVRLDCFSLDLGPLRRNGRIPALIRSTHALAERLPMLRIEVGGRVR